MIKITICIKWNEFKIYFKISIKLLIGLDNLENNSLCNYTTFNFWIVLPQHSHNCLTALCPGLPRWASIRRDIHPLTWGCYHLGYMVKGGDNRGRCNNNPAGHHPIQTIGAPISPPFYDRCYSSQFILAWDRHQVCWVAYPGALFFNLIFIQNNSRSS